MLELPADVGGAAKQFYDRHHMLVLSFVLSAAGIGTGTATALALSQGIPTAAIIGALLGFGSSVVLAGAIAFWQTRHLPLTAVTVLAPVPGLIWAAPISTGADFGMVPFLAYGFGFAVAALCAETVVRRALSAAEAERPWAAAGASLALTAVLAVVWFRGALGADAALQAVADCALSSLSVLALMPLALPWMRFDEAFVVRSNRARERRQRRFEVLARAAIPRWALSFTGIAGVFLALGWFGVEPASRHDLWRNAITASVVFASAWAAAGGWREGLAIAAIGAETGLLALWAQAIRQGLPYASVGVLELGAIAVLLGLYGGRLGAALRSGGEAPVVAQRRVIESASGPLFAGLGAVAASLPALALTPGAVLFVVGLVVATGCGAILTPVVSAGLEALRPRRRSVEELYGRHKPVH